MEKTVSVRLNHAKEPGRPSREDFDRYPLLVQCLERVLCQCAHFRIIIID